MSVALFTFPLCSSSGCAAAARGSALGCGCAPGLPTGGSSFAVRRPDRSALLARWQAACQRRPPLLIRKGMRVQPAMPSCHAQGSKRMHCNPVQVTGTVPAGASWGCESPTPAEERLRVQGAADRHVRDRACAGAHRGSAPSEPAATHGMLPLLALVTGKTRCCWAAHAHTQTGEYP